MRVKRPLSDCPPQPRQEDPLQVPGAGTVCPTQWCYSVSNTSVFFKTSIDIKNKKNYWKVYMDSSFVLYFPLTFVL